MRLPPNLTFSVFCWPGPGSALPCCFVMRSIAISVSHPFILKIGWKKTNISAIFPLPHQPFSPGFLCSFCTCHSDRVSVPVGCSVKLSGLGADQVTVSVLFNRYLQVIFRAFGSCCAQLQSPHYLQWFVRANRASHALILIFNTTKASHFPTDYPHFKLRWRKSWWHMVGMIISGRITEWACTSGVGNKGHVEGKEG